MLSSSSGHSVKPAGAKIVSELIY